MDDYEQQPIVLRVIIAAFIICMIALALSANAQPPLTWCPVQVHDHTKYFRIGQWIEKGGVQTRVRVCQYKQCKNYKLKQTQKRKV